MESMDVGASVYSEAKGEYTRQLTLFIVPSFHKFFMGCLEQAAAEEPQTKKQLWKFQEMLSQVPEWNMDKVQREVAKLISEIQCDYLEELVTAVFIAHTKVLTAIRIGNKNKRVQITIPKLEHFIHRALSECSRLLWSSAYLFHNELPPMEKQKNHRQIEQLLHEGVAQAIRGLLPVKNILKDYLSEPDTAEDAEDAEDEDEKEEKEENDMAKKQEGVVEKVVEEELKPTVVETLDTTTPSAVEAPVMKEDSPAVPVVALEEFSKTTVVEKLEAPAEPAPVPVVPVVPVVSVVSTPSNPSNPSTPSNTSNHSTTPVVEETPKPSVSGPPTLVIETEPSVRFTNFDQVIKTKGGETHIGYVEKNRDLEDETDRMEFMDDDGESLSDYEDLTDYPVEELNTGDFEVLS